MKGPNIVLKDLYVGNLQWNTSEKELEEIFSQYGNIYSIKIIKDRETGKSKGFAFIKMENADTAKASLNGYEIRGRSIKINDSRREVN